MNLSFQWGDELALANGATAKTTTTLREFFKERGVMFSEAGEKLVSDKFKLIKEYIKDIESQTGHLIPDNQLEKLKQAIRNKNYGRLTPKEVAKSRAEFNKVKKQLIADWELNTGQKWPTYTEDIIGKNGNIVRKAGDKFDAHHIIENSYGGNNEWWNIHPAKFPNEHQSGIHRAYSPARKLFNGGQ